MRYAWAAGALLLLLAGASIWHSKAVRDADKDGYKRATGEMQKTIAAENAKARSDEQAAQKRANEVERDHQQALAAKDARYAAHPVPAVRLCPPATRPVRVPAVAGTAGSDPGASGRDGLPGPVVADIGPDLERLVRLADIQTQRLISCQKFASKQK